MTQKTCCQFIGQSTVLIKSGEKAIITDPHLSSHTLFFKRRTPLPFSPALLPPLSAVLVSHTHYDHLNVASYKFFPCDLPIIVPEKAERVIGQFVTNPIIELSYFASHVLSDGTKITALPSKHASSRMFQFGFRKTNSYLIEPAGQPFKIFFCGDSGYGPHFEEIGSMGKIDIALLPIGSYSPGFLLKNFHMNPLEATRAFKDLKAEHMIPIHHSTFCLSLENINEPVLWLKKILAENSDLSQRVHILNAGEEFCVETRGGE